MRRYDLLVVLTLAMVLRLLFLFVWSPGLAGDAWDYDRLAHSLLEGRGYTNTQGELTSWRPPLYPAVVAAVYALTAGSVQAVRALQVALDLGTVVLTYRIAAWLFGSGAGLVASFLVAANLGTVAATSRLESETLFTFLLIAGVAVSVVWLRAIRDGRVHAAVALGMAGGSLFGAATLSRGVLLLYPLPLIVLTAVGLRGSGSLSVQAPTVSERRQAALVGCLALALAFVLILTPWTVRNYRVHGAFIPVATQLGAMLYLSYNPLNGWTFGDIPQDEVIESARRLPERERNAFLVRAAVDSIRDFPLKALKLEILKILYFWVPLDWEILPFYGVFNSTYAFIALWAFFYVAFGPWRESFLPTGAAWLPVLYLFVLALVFHGSPRYRLPAEPLLAVFAAAQLVVLDRAVGRRTSAAMVGGTVALLLLVLAFAGPLKDFAKSLIIGAG